MKARFEKNDGGATEKENVNVIPDDTEEKMMLSTQTSKLSKETNRKSEKDSQEKHNCEIRYRKKDKQGHKLMPYLSCKRCRK